MYLRVLAGFLVGAAGAGQLKKPYVYARERSARLITIPSRVTSKEIQLPVDTVARDKEFFEQLSNEQLYSWYNHDCRYPFLLELDELQKCQLLRETFNAASFEQFLDQRKNGERVPIPWPSEVSKCEECGVEGSKG